MRRMHVLVEGQTEETFVREILAPDLERVSLYLNPVIIRTGYIEGKASRGGLSHYHPLRRHLLDLLGDRGAAGVTTMFDFYDLPKDFPGWRDLPTGKAADRAEHLEQALVDDIGDQRLLPYLSLHEFEALVFVGLPALETVIPKNEDVISILTQEISGFPNPEEIDDGPGTHPSARLKKHLPEFRKRLHGPQILAEVGLPTLRARCPHFDRWIARLENFD